MASFDADEINTSNNHFDENDGYSGYDSFSDFPAAEQPTSGGFSDDLDIAVNHSSGSPPVYGFENPSPNFSESSPFEPIHVESGSGNGNGIGNAFGYGAGENGISDGVFTSDVPVLPPPTEMEPEEGAALRKWRR